MQGFKEWFDTDSSEKLENLLLQGTRKVSGDQDELFENASRILTQGVEFYLPFDEADRNRFPRLFMQSMKRSMRDGRGAR